MKQKETAQQQHFTELTPAGLHVLQQHLMLLTLNLQGTIQYVSPLLAEQVGHAPKELVGKGYDSLLAEEQRADGLWEYAQHMLKSDKAWKGDFRYQVVSGKTFWAETTIRLMEAENTYMVLLYPITKYKEAEQTVQEQNEALRASEEELRQNLEELHATQEQLIKAEEQAQYKSRLLWAVGEANERLIQEEIWFTALGESMQLIGEATQMDRVYYFESFKNPNTGEVLTSQRLEWAKDGQLAEIDNPEMQNMPIELFAECYYTLIKGEVYQAIVAKIEDENFRELLQSQDIKILLCIPIFLNQEFHGFVGFDNCSSERLMTTDEVSILHSLAGNLSAALWQRRNEQKMKEANEELQASEEELRQNLEELNATQEQLIKAEEQTRYKSRLLWAVGEANEHLIQEEVWFTALGESMRLIGEATQMDRVYYFESFTDPDTQEVLTSQRLEWAKDGSLAEIDNPEMQNMPVELFAECYYTLIKGQVYQAIVAKIEDDDFRGLLQSQDIKTLLCIPIFLDHVFHGFVGFDNCSSERLMTTDEVSILHSLAGNLSAALWQRRNERKMKEANEELQASEEELRQNLEELHATQDKLEQEQEALIESSERYRVLTENMEGFTYRCKNDKGWTILYMSKKVQALTGYPASDFIEGKRSFSGLTHPDDIAHVSESIELALKKKLPIKVEYRILHRDGSVRWAYEKGQVVEDAQGQVRFLDGFVMDITERKEAEAIIQQKNEALQQSLEQLELLRKKSEESRQRVEKLLQNVTSSINYAKRIQRAMLPDKASLKPHFDSFIFYRPRDIVSGDFYWFAQKGDVKLLAVLDCTGHGVSGAFMTMIAKNILDKIVHEQKIYQPDQILNRIPRLLQDILSKKNGRLNDGMDIGILAITDSQVSYAGAIMPLYYQQNGILHEIRGDKRPIGINSEKYRFQQTPYTLHTISLDSATTFYLASDGYQDQFGGELDRKFLRSQFKALLESFAAVPFDDQRQELENTFEQWRNGKKQTDDVLVVGLRL